MKIALVGNLNNNFSSICRYLLDEGFDVYLFKFSNEPDHFLPKHDMFEDVLLNKVKILPFSSVADIFNRDLTRSIKAEFAQYELIIGCGYLPALFSKIGKKLDVFIPYGSDVYSAPFFKFTLNPKAFIANLYFSIHQRRGIRNASYMILENQSNFTESQILKIEFKGERIKTSVPIIHIKTYQHISEENLSKLQFYKQYLSIRAEYDLIIFHHSRHSWFDPKDINEQKGNNHLFSGFAKFLKSNPTFKAAIITLEYGDDVEKSKELIAELDIEGNVFWFPKQSRREIMAGLKLSDIVVAELHGDYNLYGTVIEALVSGKSVMQYRDDNKHKHQYNNNLHKALIANSAETVYDQLSLFISDQNYYLSQGLKGLDWYKQNIVLPFLVNIKNIIKQKNDRTN